MTNLIDYLFLKKLNLPVKFRIFSLFIILVIFIGFMAELLSIGMIVPLLTALFDGEKLSFFLSYIPDFFDFSSFSQNDFIRFFLVLILFVYSIKIIIIFFQNYFIAKYSLSLSLYIQNQMINNYLKKSIDFYNNVNSSIMIRNISTEVSIFINHVLIPIYSMITEFLVLFGIIILILFVEFKIGIYILILSVFTILILRSVFQKKLNKWGLERQKFSASSLQKINDIFFLHKEIKILKKEKYFNDSLYLYLFKLGKTQFYKRIIQPLPRLFGEILAVVSFCILVFTLLNDQKNGTEIITILALFAACAFRLIPSFNRLAEFYNAYKFALPSYKVIAEQIVPNKYNFDEIVSKKFSNQKFKNIEIKNLNFKYENKIILNDLNLRVEKNDMIGIVGKSGSGKTTLINILLGFHKIKETIYYNDSKVDDIRVWLTNVGYVAQDTYLLDSSIKENIAFGINKDQIDLTKIDEVIESSQLSEMINNLENGIDTIIGENGVRLSGGQKQRLGIARALYFNPEVMIFDEVTSSLDLQTENEFLNSILKFKKQKTLIIVTHRPSLLRACNKIYKLEEGKLTIES